MIRQSDEEHGGSVGRVLLNDSPQQRLAGEVLTVAEVIATLRRARSSYFDDETGTDGAFSILLAMYIDVAKGATTPIERLLEAADVPLSTGLYLLRVLTDAHQVRPCGSETSERYTLTAAAERAMQCYLADTVDIFRRAGRAIN